MKKEAFVALYAGLSEQQRTLVRNKLRENHIDFSSFPIVARPPELSLPPLSYAQQRLWFLDQYEPGSAAYNIPGAVRLQGELNKSALQASLNAIIQRHESLRTCIVLEQDQPVQKIAAAMDLLLTETDLSSLPKAERQAQLAWRIEDEAQTGFDLATGPLIRASLLKLAETEHILLFTLHHIVSDGWSMGVLIKEFAQLYAGQHDSLPALPIQYADFAHWQRSWLQGEVLQKQLSYWTKQLSGAPALLELPTDYPRPAIQGHQGGQIAILLSKELTDKLQALSQQHQASLFMTLLAGFKILLSRYSGQNDLSIGSPIANRNRKEIEGLIGFFVNTLVLRSEVNEAVSFSDFLTTVRETTLGAYEHQDIPFEQLVEVLQPERHSSHSPLFQVMFVLQNAPVSALELPGLSLDILAQEQISAKYELTLELEEKAGQLEGSLTYNTELFAATSMERMAGHFTNLLQAITASPAACISEISMLEANEQKQLLQDWNDTTVAYPENQTVIAQFEQQAAQQPEHIALVFEEEKLSYRELNAKANQLAHYLRSLGVGPDVLVGLCVERSVEMVVGLLGILKAGAAYVPLDPGYPPERLAYMLADAQPAVLLTQEHILSQLPESSSGIKTLKLDTEWALPAAFSAENPAAAMDAGNLAYVIYTSGSSGKPKAVAVSHAALANHMRWMLRELPLHGHDAVLQKTAISFDASVWEVFAPLMAGARLVLAAPGVERDPQAMVQALANNEISVLQLVPSMLRMLVAYPELAGCARLRRLCCGGEILAAELVRQALAILPTGAECINLYGPTEATVQVMFERVTAADEVVTIGRPIDNTSIYLLDTYLNPVPVGVVGELYIAGASLARGYLHRPELSAEKFIPNPFAITAGERMYKTGDLACYLPDGNIEYIGRADEQIKLRGFRIELGEIEAALHAQPGIRESVVLVRQDSPGDKRLVAYIVAEAAIQEEVLRNALGRSLPEYMIPSHFLQLEQLPLTPNGKVDKKALPAPDKSRHEAGYVAPQSETEILLASIWAEVLQLDKVGIHDNFFALGGHSLLATQVISRLRKACQRELPLRLLFETSSLAALAQRIDQQEQAASAPQQIEPVRRDQALPLSYAQQRLWFLDQYEPGSAAYNIPGAVRLQGELNKSSLQASLNAIIQRHESLRTCIVLEQDQPVQKIAAAMDLLLTETDLSSLPKAERQAQLAWRIEDEAQTGFDLATGPLIRASLLKLAETEHILLFTLHHIVSDGWSMGVLIKEFAQLYAGQHDSLPALPIQYADFAHWQRSWLQGEVLQKQLSYWKTKLSGAPALLELPTDYPRSAIQGHQGAQVAISLSKELTDKLQALSQQHQASLFMTLLAGFKILLSRYSGQNDLSIGSPIANRNRKEIEGLIGFFVNTLVLRSEVNEAVSFSDFLKHVRETTLGAYEYQDIPFEQLVEVLQPERHSSHSPLFQVMFVLQNAPVSELQLPGLQLDMLESSSVSAKYDLTLQFEERAGQLQGSLTYNTDLFAAATIERMGRHFQTLLAAISDAPGKTIAELPLLDLAEQRQQLQDWNNTAASFASETVQQQFEAQAELHPEHIAVVYEEQQLTYRQLNAKANQLAHHLRSLGVGPDVLVGLCVERSLEMIIGLLGILKAGGAYVPLDPAYPQERLAYMLDDAQPAVIITMSALTSRLHMTAIPLLVLDEQIDAAQITQQASSNLDASLTRLSLDHLAYVIYTSGSTGKPKGVMNQHSSLANLVAAQVRMLEVTGQSRILQTISHAFDVFLSEVFMTLCSGAYLCIGKQEDILGRANFPIIERHRISHVGLPLAVMASLPREADFKQVETLIVGGETVPVALAQHWSARHRFFNSYGPTETTITATHYLCSSEDENCIPIGQPLNNVRIYICDTHLRLIPQGMVGEVYIAGASLARGYLHRPELSAEKFIPNPFAITAGERMYKTGDLARYLPDGNIEYIGRADEQIKLRGFRIELGEIEAALHAQPGIRESVVLVRQDSPGDKRLVAYIVAEAAIQEEVLRNALGRSLPEYMIPSHFLQLEQLPLTPNGKVDKKALPAPDKSRHEAGYVAPQSETEILLAGIWAEVLQLDKVGIHDNFFALGGHSLLATQVISRLRKACQRELPLRLLFETSSLAALAQRIDQQEQAASAPQQIEPVRRDQALPLSYAQQRLWFLDQYEPGSAAYNIPGAVRLQGELNKPALQASLNAIIQRHESLRTRIVLEQDQPVQKIAAAMDLLLTETDLSSLPKAERQAQLEWRIEDEAQSGFDLATGPLIRASLLKLAETEHILLFTLHHIVSDGWSMGVLIKEFAQLYAGQHDSLPALPIQYADFAHWQRSWLQGEVLQKQLSYWKTKLSGAPALLELPTDYPRPAIQGHQGAQVAISLSKDLTDKLQVLSQQHQASLFMTLLAGFKILLSRYSGQNDLSIGSPIANRNRKEIEGLIGFFVNTLVLRSEVNETESFSDFLKHVRETTLGAYEHQDIPFEQLVEVLQPERHSSHSPLFQVMFVLQNAPVSELQLPGLQLDMLESSSVSAKYDLTLQFEERAGQLQGSLTYNTDLFAAATIERMGRHFQTLLAAISDAPGKTIAELPLLDLAEQRQQLQDWNNTAASFASETVQQQFEAQAELHPEHIAVVYEEQQLTYRQLNAKANQLAHHLRSLGVGPDVLVGLCVERSLEMIIGLLGILKAGGAYVPLDPAYPEERLAYMLDDAQPLVLLTQESVSHKLPGSGNSKRLCLDTAWQFFSEEAPHNPVHEVDGDNLAYVIYTSGSTGKPKGVLVRHGALTNFLHAMQDQPGIDASAVVLNLTSLSFDIAALELFLPLVKGATTVLATRESTADPEKLMACIENAQVSVIQATPTSWRVLVEQMEKMAPQRKQGLTVLCGGEALSEDLKQHLLQHVPQVWNMYGPTETTIWSMLKKISKDEEQLSIGQPIANTGIYLLDSHLRPVPIGVSGELYIAGAGLALGYLHRPELSAEKFIPNPFAITAGERMYKTGDLARYLPDGNIEYIGRADEQIKLRGFRIELGEIEAALHAQPGIRESVVLVRQDSPGDKRLVAYIVAEAAIQEEVLRNALGRSLPEYMIPSHFLQLEQLPLTPNGKVDKKALPAPDKSRHEAGYVAPQSETEILLAGIWAEVLQLDKVGIHDNFFALGGHSLLATQVISRLRKVCQRELPLRLLFETSSLAALAQKIEQSLQEQIANKVGQIEPVRRDQPLPLSYAQQRLWFLDQYEPGSAAYNIPGAVRLQGELNKPALQASLNAIIQRHESLRTRIVLEQDQPVQKIAAAMDLLLTETDLSSLPKAERQAQLEWRIEDEAQSGFDLATGPLIRASLLKLAETEHILLFTLHHIVSDGWSMGVLIKEFAQLYAGQHDSLPALPIQYADFAHWQRSWLQGEVLQKQLSYWKTKLSGAPALLELPTDYPRPAIQGHQGSQVKLNIGKELTDKLQALSQQHQASLFMTLLAGFKILLSRYSGQNDLSIGSPIANRNRKEIEGLIGFFVNTLVLRSEVNETESFSDFLKHVRETTLGAYEHQDIPFEQLVEVLQPERHSSHSPLFQVMFVLQNAPVSELQLPGLQLDMLESSSVSAKYDLTLQFEERAGQLQGGLTYNTELFDSSSIERMARHFTNLLEAVAAEPAACISEISMLEANEQKQLLQDWNDTTVAYPENQTVIAQFEQQAAQQPEHIALVFEEEKLSYRELNAKANQLAHYLRSLGVGPDVLVGLCVERSVEMVVGLLGILKAGAAYVPLDPGYPPERLAYMLADAQPAVLLTQERILTQLPESNSGIKTLKLDTEWALPAAYPAENPAVVLDSDNLAYVIYTSGSTGKPKGAGNHHRGLYNRLAWMQQAYGLTATDRVLQKTPFSFDVSAWEFFWPLAYGSTLVMARPGGHQDTDYLSTLMRQESITTMHFVPPMLEVFLAELERHDFPALRQIICSGQALPFELQQRFFTQLSHVDLHNLYGPTEASIDVTYWQCRPDSGLAGVPIGRPIANTRIYLLDNYLNPVPAGVAGELYIAGAGLARGYLRRPELSAEKFIPDPFATIAGQRIYKTGDLARYLPDGNIDYLGRMDEQIKLRGFRIELGEVEAALGAQPGIREAIVIAREDNPGDKRLVAYLVSAEEVQEDVLRSALGRSLPEYMIPSHFVQLEQLPLTPNGKVDRKALPAPDKSRPEAGYVEPQSETEILLAGIWADVLKTDKVGLHDNFFALGGHSLLAVSLIEKMRRAGIHIDVRSLFATPTIAALAAPEAQTDDVVQVPPNGIPPGCTALLPEMLPLVTLNAEELQRITGQVPGGAANIQDIYPLAPLQEGIVFHHLMNDVGDTYLQPSLLAFDSKSRLDSFTGALQQVIQRHDILRTAVLWEGLPQPVQVVLRAATVVIEHSQCKADDGDISQQLSAQYDPRHYRLDIRQAPLLHAVIAHDQPNQRWLLLLLQHHLVIDHTTLELLIKEVQIIMQGQADSLPAPEPFRNFVAQARLGVSEAEHSRFFEDMLGQVTEATLPFGLTNVQGDGARIKEARMEVDAKLARKLRQQARQMAVSPASLMHLAWAQVLARLSGQEQVVFGTVLFGRMQGGAGADRTMGMFINTLPICIAVNGSSVQSRPAANA